MDWLAERLGAASYGFEICSLFFTRHVINLVLGPYWCCLVLYLCSQLQDKSDSCMEFCTYWSSTKANSRHKYLFSGH